MRTLKKYAIERDCCTSGNCSTCHDLPYGTKRRVEQTDADTPEEADRIRDNWRAYNATVMER
jgi:Fe-S cluster biogenesis protein NfuA